LIPKKLIDKVVVTQDVAEVTRQITPAELKRIFKDAIREEVEPVRGRLEPIKEELRQLRAELEAHNRRLDERLREVSKPKSFWARLFNK
jgi:replication fork clamp-binding protein CrfC